MEYKVLDDTKVEKSDDLNLGDTLQDHEEEVFCEKIKDLAII